MRHEGFVVQRDLYGYPWARAGRKSARVLADRKESSAGPRQHEQMHTENEQHAHGHGVRHRDDDVDRRAYQFEVAAVKMSSAIFSNALAAAVSSSDGFSGSYSSNAEKDRFNSSFDRTRSV